MTKEEFIKESKNGTLNKLIMSEVNRLCGINSLDDIKNLSNEEKENFKLIRKEAIETVNSDIERIRLEIQEEKEAQNKLEDEELPESENIEDVPNQEVPIPTQEFPEDLIE